MRSTYAFRRAQRAMTAACVTIRAKLKAARVIASDETSTRIDVAGHCHWVFVSPAAVLHRIASRRAKAVAQEALGDHRRAHQVCLADVLRDVKYPVDCGDQVFAPKRRALLRWAIRIGRRRETLRPTTLQQYHARAERRLDGLVTMPTAHPAGRELQDAVTAWRTKFFVFLEDPDGPPTNNSCEREICPSVVFRKVTGRFRSTWGAQIHAGYRSVTGTARLSGQTALQAINHLLTGRFEPTPAT